MTITTWILENKSIIPVLIILGTITIFFSIVRKFKDWIELSIIQSRILGGVGSALLLIGCICLFISVNGVSVKLKPDDVSVNTPKGGNPTISSTSVTLGYSIKLDEAIMGKNNTWEISLNGTTKKQDKHLWILVKPMGDSKYYYKNSLDSDIIDGHFNKTVYGSQNEKFNIIIAQAKDEQANEKMEHLGQDDAIEKLPDNVEIVCIEKINVKPH
jgi:hypothetical protein